jgi:PKD repeat protein
VTVVNASPVAVFSVTCAELTCTFNASASTDADDGILSYRWNFGNGSSSSLSSPVVTRVYQGAGTYLVTLTVTDRAGQTTSSSQNVTVAATQPPVVLMHVGDLDGSSTNQQKTWTATATVEIHREDHQPLGGVTVSGTWNGGTAATCTTNTAGRCGFSRTGLANKTNSATLTVTSAVRATFTYALAANHDPESDSNGTSIIIRRR